MGRKNIYCRSIFICHVKCNLIDVIFEEKKWINSISRLEYFSRYRICKLKGNFYNKSWFISVKRYPTIKIRFKNIKSMLYVYNFDWLSETVDESAEADCVGKYIFERSWYCFLNETNMWLVFVVISCFLITISSTLINLHIE